MAVFVATLVLFLLAVGGMSIGLLRGRRLSGSCGGVDREGRPIGDCHCGQTPSNACAAPETTKAG
jgi:hypothetical protein